MAGKPVKLSINKSLSVMKMIIMAVGMFFDKNTKNKC